MPSKTANKTDNIPQRLSKPEEQVNNENTVPDKAPNSTDQSHKALSFDNKPSRISTLG